jgi:hypothetical protein
MDLAGQRGFAGAASATAKVEAAHYGAGERYVRQRLDAHRPTRRRERPEFEGR